MFNQWLVHNTIERVSAWINSVQTDLKRSIAVTLSVNMCNNNINCSECHIRSRVVEEISSQNNNNDTISDNDRRVVHVSTMDLYRRNLHWNTKNKSIAPTSGTSSDKDTTCQSQQTSANRSRTSNITAVKMGNSSSSRTGSSESVTLVKCSSPNQSDRRRRSFRLKKGNISFISP